jgi:endonuclease YncB( thermonuclease family)
VIAFIAATIGLSHAATPAQTKIIKGQVVGVHDGDSITVLTAGKVQVKVRLEGIDAPELKQAFSQQSKQAMSEMVFGKVVTLHVTGVDRYKRTLAVVTADGVNANLELVRRGLAWRFDKYSKDAALLAAQHEAQAARRGLWADKDPVPPWDFRKR